MGRLQSVDALRTIAVILVIAIHTTPFETQSTPIGRFLDLATVINQVARFAVPFFFVLSGYFWAQKFKDEQGVYLPSVNAIKRIAFLFVAWSAIYLFPMNIWDAFDHGAIGPIKGIYWNLNNAMNRPWVTLMEGSKVHLWFLVGLLCSTFISAILLRLRLKRLLVIVAVTFYVIGLAGGAYADTPLGFRADFNFRNGPFFSLLLFVTGYFIQKKQPDHSWFLIGVSVALFGLALHFSELWLLQKYWGASMRQDYVFGTYFFGVGATLVALSDTKWLHIYRIASIGPLVLGIYASHFIFVDMLKPLDRYFIDNEIWDVFYLAAAFLLSYALASMLSRFHLTRRLVI